MQGLEKCAQNCITVKSDATQLITSLLDFFSIFSILKEDLDKLKSWQSTHSNNGHSSDAFKALLENLVQVWNQEWPAQREKVIEQENWLGLSHSTCTKDKLDIWMTQLPTQEAAFAQWSELLQMDFYNQWIQVAQTMRDVVQTGATATSSSVMPLALSQSNQTVSMSL